MTISKTIRTHLEHRPFGELITATGLLGLGLGTRTAIDQTLSRLCRQGFIARIARGVYAKPRATRFGGRILPEANEIATAFAKLRGQQLQIHGAEAVRRFGLTTQMPATTTYLTDGPNRTLHLGNLEVHLEHAPAKMFLLAGRLAGQALRALRFLGRRETKPKTINQVLQQLPNLEREALLETRASLPNWLSKPLDVWCNSGASI